MHINYTLPHKVLYGYLLGVWKQYQILTVSAEYRLLVYQVHIGAGFLIYGLFNSENELLD